MSTTWFVFLDELPDGNAKTITNHAKRNIHTHAKIPKIFLLLNNPHDTAWTFSGTAFELSENCGLVSSSESRISSKDKVACILTFSFTTSSGWSVLITSGL